MRITEEIIKDAEEVLEIFEEESIIRELELFEDDIVAVIAELSVKLIERETEITSVNGACYNVKKELLELSAKLREREALTPEIIKCLGSGVLAEEILIHKCNNEGLEVGQTDYRDAYRGDIEETKRLLKKLKR